MVSKKSVIIGLLVSVFSIGSIHTASAETTQQKAEWLKKHPRRAEVNARLANQNKRINTERKEGEITGKQAAKLHSEDRQIRREEHRMAQQQNGHITKKEQIRLNQQENQVSKQIGQ